MGLLEMAIAADHRVFHIEHPSSSSKQRQLCSASKWSAQSCGAYQPEGSDPMRYVLAAIFICAAGMSLASALPTASPHSVSVSKAAPIVQATKRNRPHAHHHSRRDDGIHPLVGSGDY